jgi:hypothetical protein
MQHRVRQILLPVWLLPPFFDDLMCRLLQPLDVTSMCDFRRHKVVALPRSSSHAPHLFQGNLLAHLQMDA